MIYYMKETNEMFIELIQYHVDFGHIQTLHTNDEDEKTIGIGFIRSTTFEPNGQESWQQKNARVGINIENLHQLYLMLEPMKDYINEIIREEDDSNIIKQFEENRKELENILQDIIKNITKDDLDISTDVGIHYKDSPDQHIITMIPSLKLIEPFISRFSDEKVRSKSLGFGFQNKDVKAEDNQKLIFTFAHTFDLSIYIQSIIRPLKEESQHLEIVEKLDHLASKFVDMDAWIPAYQQLHDLD